MSFQNFLFKLYILLAINSLQARIINNLNDYENKENSIEHLDSAPRTSYIRSQRPDFGHVFSESEDLDINEIRGEPFHRNTAGRIRSYDEEGAPNNHRPTNTMRQYGGGFGVHSPSMDRPRLESQWGRSRNLWNDASNRPFGSLKGWNLAKMNPNNLHSDNEFEDKLTSVEIDSDHTNPELDINSLLPEKQERITNYRWKPATSFDNSDKINVDQSLRPENKGIQSYTRFYHNKINPENTHLDNFNINDKLKPDNADTVTINRWKPTGIYSNSGNNYQSNYKRPENEEGTVSNNRWKLIGTETNSNSHNTKINRTLAPDNEEIVSNHLSIDSKLVLTDDDLKEIKLAIELNWSNVNQDNVIKMFRTYWYKFVMTLGNLDESSDKNKRDYLVWLLDTMKKSIISNPNYMGTYLEALPALKENEEPDNQIVHHSPETHQTSTNNLPIDIPPPVGLIKKICEAVNQNLEDFWKIFYTHFGKQQNRNNLQELEKLYLILTIFTQLSKAKPLSLPIDEYVDKIIQIIQPDVHSLGPILTLDSEPSKLNGNITCVSCNGDKIKHIVNGIIERVPAETDTILSKLPNNNNSEFEPRVNEWHVLDKEHGATEKNNIKPTINTVTSIPHIGHVEETNTFELILDSNELKSLTSKPTRIKDTNYSQQNHSISDNSKEDRKNKPVQDANNVESSAIEQVPIKIIKSIPGPDNLKVQTAKPMGYLNNIEINTVNTIQEGTHQNKPDIKLPDAKTVKLLPQINTIEETAMGHQPNSEDQLSEVIEPILGDDEITIQDLHIPDKNFVTLVSDTNYLPTKIIIPEEDKTKEKTTKPTPILGNSDPTTVIPTLDSDKVKENIYDLGKIEANTVKIITDSDNTNIKPKRPVPSIIMPVQTTETYFHVTSNKYEDTPLNTNVENEKNILKPNQLDVEKVDTMETNPHPMPNIIYENADTMQDAKTNQTPRTKVKSLKEYYSDPSIEEIKDVIQGGKPLSEHKEENYVHNTTQIMAPFGPFYNLWLSMIRSINPNLILPQPMQNEVYVVQPNSDNQLTSPEIVNLSKNLQNPIEKSNNENNIPIMDKNNTDLIEKVPLHPNYEPQNKPSNQLTELASVDIVSNESVESLPPIIVGQLKGLITNLGLDNLMVPLNFDLILRYLTQFLLKVFKTLTANGISVPTIMAIVMDTLDKLRAFQSAELQICLRKILLVMSDIMSSVIEKVMKNLPK